MDRIFGYLVVLCLSLSSCVSCQNSYDIDFKKINFEDNDIFINYITRENDILKDIQIIVKLTEKAPDVEKIDDFSSICIVFKDTDVLSMGQQAFLLSNNITTSRDGVILTEYKLAERNYLILNFIIFTLGLSNLDEIICYFHLRDNNRTPILRENTENFYYR